MVDWHCRAEDIQAYVDGELDGFALQECEAHLRRCPACARLAGRLLALSQSLGAVEPQRPPADLRERVLEAVAQALDTPPLGCAEAAALASAYLDDELDSADRDRLETHLFACPTCYARHRRTQSVVESLRLIPAAAAPADLYARIVAGVAHEAGRGVVFTWRRVAQVVAGCAAAAAVALAVFVPNRHEPVITTEAPPVVAALPAPEDTAPAPAASSVAASALTEPTAGSVESAAPRRETAVSGPARPGTSAPSGHHETDPAPAPEVRSPAAEVTPPGPGAPDVEEPVMVAARPGAGVRPAAPTIMIADAPPGPATITPPATTDPAPAPARIALAPEPPIEASARPAEPERTTYAVGAVPYRAGYVRVHDGGSQRDPETDRRMAAAITERARAGAWITEDTGIELR